MYKYPASQLSVHEGGCQLDLRVRLAIEFVKSGALTWDLSAPPEGPAHATAESYAQAVRALTAKYTAQMALDLADELLEQADARGWVQPLPDHGELLQPERNHIERTAKAQVWGQMAAQRFAQEEASRVVPVHGGLPTS